VSPEQEQERDATTATGASEPAGTEPAGTAGATGSEEPGVPAAFSPEGSGLFLRAQAALAKLDPDAVPAAKGDRSGAEEPARVPSAKVPSVEAAQEDEAEGKPEAVDEHVRAAAPDTAAEETEGPTEEATREPLETEPAEADAREDDPADPAATEATPAPEETAEPARTSETAKTSEAAETARTTEAAEKAEVAGTAVAEATASGAGALVPRPAAPVQRPSGHFTVPTAVAVVPATTPVRRPSAEGGFDFFGTKSAAPSEALEAVQNEDLADVVGQEALALHKAEAEAEFKPAGAEARGVGQVIDLTAHDETEHIDLQGLRSAVS
jgi:hypothetical protein